MTFKEQLQEHFKGFPASPFLFVGAGMSRRYIHTESWEELLIKFCDLIGENYTKIKSQANGDFPVIASILAEKYSEEWWSSPIKGDKESLYSDDLIKSDSPLKVEIADYVKHVHENVNSEFSEEIELLRKGCIDGIITTNWDLFLESLFPEFSVYIGQDGLFANRNHGVAEIYKIHGCCNDPNSQILTASDYEEFRKKNPYLSSKLLTTFIERPIIFLGYSLSDPHILEILEDIVRCFPEKKIDALKNNVIFFEWVPDIEVPTITESVLLKTLPVKLIRSRDYIDLFQVLSEMHRRIPAHVFRQIKDELYDLVLTNDPKGKLYVKDADEVAEDKTPNEYVVGYGAIGKTKKSEHISKLGVVGLDRQDLVRDVIFESNSYSSTDIVFEAFPKLLKGNTKCPVFKYLFETGLVSDQGEVDTDGLCEGLIIRSSASVSHFRPQGYEAQRASNIPEVEIGIKELYDLDDLNLFLRMAVFVPAEKVELNEFQSILKKHVDDAFTSNERSQFVRLACFYDLLKYSCKHETLGA